MTQELELTIERPVAGGRMLARHDGLVVLVTGAIPGERVRVRIERAERRVAFAETIDVLEPSEHRRPTTADPQCGGLLLAHIAYEYQLQLKSEILTDTFRRVGKLQLPAEPRVSPSPEVGYRLRARLHVRGGRAGFFREGSRVLCDAGPSRQLSPGALPAVESLLGELGGFVTLIDAVSLAENLRADQRIAVIELAESVSRLPAPQALASGVDGVGLLVRGELQPLIGAQTIHESLADLGLAHVSPAVGLQRSPTSFFQSNRFLIGSLVGAVLEAATGGRVFDLYAGVGLFSVPLALRGVAVTAVEGDPVSGRDLLANASSIDGLTAKVSSVEAAVHEPPADPVDCVIVDPPRTGMSPLALARVSTLRAPRIVYVSCDPATLARDAAGFVKAGYALTSLDAFDMFPNTPHIEALAVFDRMVP
jgi:23S rRNA (uracil1939-C5)-methyltransferase